MGDTIAALKSISIRNFRCFSDEEIEFAEPDGSCGSGLTLIVGENGTGKTTVLDAVDIGLGGKYRAESRARIDDFSNFEKQIEIECLTDRYKVNAGSDFMKGKYFNCLGAKASIKGRDRKAGGKFLSGPIQATCAHMVDEDFYYDKDDNPFRMEKPVDGRDKVFSADQVGDGITVFYFDKNRARHLSQGTYRTTFDAICDDLNWKFRKELSLSGKLKDYRLRASDNAFDWVLQLAQPATGEKLAESFAEFFNEGEYQQLRIDLFDLLEPFSGASFTIREKESLTGISPKKLGSGVELVLALLLQKFLYPPTPVWTASSPPT